MTKFFFDDSLTFGHFNAFDLPIVIIIMLNNHRIRYDTYRCKWLIFLMGFCFRHTWVGIFRFRSHQVIESERSQRIFWLIYGDLKRSAYYILCKQNRKIIHTIECVDAANGPLQITSRISSINYIHWLNDWDWICVYMFICTRKLIDFTTRIHVWPWL